MISVGFPSLNRFELTRKTCHSILENTKASYELIIWDNASTQDGMKKWLKSFEEKHEHVRLFLSDKNIGSGPAHHKVLEKANGEFVITLANDYKVDNRWLKKLKKTYEKLPDRCVVKPAKLNNESKILDLGQEILDYGHQIKVVQADHRGIPYDNNSLPEFLEAELVNSAGLFIPKSITNEVQFSTDQFVGMTDVDFSMQLKEQDIPQFATSNTYVMDLETSHRNQYQSYEEQRNSIETQFESYQFFYEKWGWLPVQLYPDFFDFTGEYNKLNNLSDNLKKIISGAREHSQRKIHPTIYKTFCKIIFLKHDPEQANKSLRSLINRLEKDRPKWMLSRFMARLFKDQGVQNLALEYFEKAVKFEVNKQKGVGDWFHIAQLSNGKIKKQAMNILEKRKPSLLDKIDDTSP